MSENNLSFTEFANLSGDVGDAFFEPLSNERIAELTGLEPERVWKSTRVRNRNITREGIDPIDIAEAITRRLFDQLDISGGDCHGLGLVHTEFSEDKVQDMAEQLADRMGIVQGEIIGFPYGCTGFVKLVEQTVPHASAMDGFQHYPLIQVETLDRYIDANDSKATPIFASAATGTTLWKGQGHALLHADVTEVIPPKNPLQEWAFRTEQVEVSDFHGNRLVKEIYRMNGKLAYENGSALIEQATRQSLDIVRNDLRYECGNVFVVPHNPNAKMIKALDDMVGPEIGVKFVNGADGMGNVSSCTIPHVLSRLEELGIAIEKGDVVLFPAAGISVRNPEEEMSQGRGAMVW